MDYHDYFYTRYFNTGEVGIRPFNFLAFKKYAYDEYKFDMSDTSKIVTIGDQLTFDVLFGSLNNMTTIWLHRFKDTCTNVKVFSE